MNTVYQAPTEYQSSRCLHLSVCSTYILSSQIANSQAISIATRPQSSKEGRGMLSLPALFVEAQSGSG